MVGRRLWLSVWMLTRVAQIVTAAHRHVGNLACADLLMNPDRTPKTKKLDTGHNRMSTKWAWICMWKSWASQLTGCLMSFSFRSEWNLSFSIVRFSSLSAFRRFISNIDFSNYLKRYWFYHVCSFSTDCIVILLCLFIFVSHCCYSITACIAGEP